MAIKETPFSDEGEKFDYIMNPVYFGHKPIGFFDGAAANGSCGVGIVLKLSSSHFFKIHLAIGIGTNIKAELIGLWGLLHFTLRLHIYDLMVVGDSKVILDSLMKNPT
jgi:ribonuclease HI